MQICHTAWLDVALRELARRRLPGRYATAAGAVDAFATSPVWMEERPAIAGAHSRRRASFQAGRACARIALNELGESPAAIPAAASGAPVWPAGYVGSISHTEEVAAAIVARNPPVRGLGLDIETDSPLEHAAMIRMVCRPEELIAGRAPARAANLNRGKLLFVIKEAVYKARAPLHPGFLDFTDINVELDEPLETFEARAANSASFETAVVRGSFIRAEGFIVAVAALD